MGLGPPVCEKCGVLAFHEGKTNQKYHSKYRWVCKFCGNRTPQWNAWDCGLTEKELEDNFKFLNFIKGKTNEGTIN